MTGRGVFNALIWVAIGLILFGYLGAWFRPADSIALLRPVLACVALLGLVSLHNWTARCVVAGIALASLLTVLNPFQSHPADGDIRIYSKNLWFNNQQMAAVAADIIDAQADAVFLQEVSNRNSDLMDRLRDVFPHQHICQFSTLTGVAIASKYPFRSTPQCSDKRAIAAAQITFQDQPLWLVSVHIPWPWPSKAAHYDESALQLLATLSGPKIIAGDFNMFPWTHRVQNFARLTDTQVAGPLRRTMTFKRMPLSIDHALAPGGGRVNMRPLLGGDHHGIVADLLLSR